MEPEPWPDRGGEGIHWGEAAAEKENVCMQQKVGGSRGEAASENSVGTSEGGEGLLRKERARSDRGGGGGKFLNYAIAMQSTDLPNQGWKLIIGRGAIYAEFWKFGCTFEHYKRIFKK